MKRATFALFMLFLFVALPVIEASDSSPPWGIEMIIMENTDAQKSNFEFVTSQAICSVCLPVNSKKLSPFLNIILSGNKGKPLNSQRELFEFLGPGDHQASTDVKS